jgi:hypothetical protein
MDREGSIVARLSVSACALALVVYGMINDPPVPGMSVVASVC